MIPPPRGLVTKFALVASLLCLSVFVISLNKLREYQEAFYRSSETVESIEISGDLHEKSTFDASALDQLIADAGPGHSKVHGIDIDQFLQEVREEDLKWNPPVKQKQPEVAPSPAGKPKYILYWNAAYGSTKYGFCCGSIPFERLQCPEQNCYATDNRTLLPSVEDYDAILFHQREAFKEDLPASRGASQRYIMFMLESPSYLFGFEPKEWNGFFNWTMTYRKDSDFQLPYGKIQSRTPLPTDDPEKLNELIFQFGQENAQYIKKPKKTKVAWFVSNCDTPSHREKFVKKLQQHIEVDIFGECGNKHCSRAKESDCWKLVSEEYKFYLSFENSICKDYVTEKFFNAMRQMVIPVTLGGADYKSLAPPHSHIDVYHEHDDPAELARLLHHIGADDALYAEYFWWKEYYEVRMGPSDRNTAFCDICQSLHRDKSTKVYDDLEDWWVQKSKCRHVRMKE